MKKGIRTIACILAILTVAIFALPACDLTRKLGGAESSFPSKVSSAETLSFKMNVSYKKGESETAISLDCYKRTNEGEEEYAYIFTSSGARYNSYKNIYADNKLYEIVNFTENTGTYYAKNDVAIDDRGNILYHVTKNILLTSVAALFAKAKKEKINGETVYRYDIDVNGNSVSIWYNKSVLVQLYAKFSGEDGADAEEYTIGLSDYKFNGTVPTDVFAKPDTYGIGYIESPISFESWMEILSSFAGKLGA